MTLIMCKASKEDDLYFEWDTSTDTPVFAGDRGEAIAWLLDYFSPHDVRRQGAATLARQVDEDLARIDKTGCAAKYAGSKFDFDAPYVHLWGRFEVARAKIPDLITAYRIAWAFELEGPTEEALVVMGVISPLELT